MKKKVRRWSASFLALLLCVTLFASTAFAAGGALGADRNGTPYTYVIGYMYSGSSQTVNTREIFTSPNNYDIWLCPVCGRDPLGNSQGTALAPNLYMPCYGYDIAAAGGDMGIRYALVRHRHNNGQLSNDRVYIPVNVPMYAGCYYGYDLTEPAGVQVSAPTGWQRDSAVVRFSGGTDTGTSLPDWSAALGAFVLWLTFFITPFHYTDCFSVRQIGYGGTIFCLVLIMMERRSHTSNTAIRSFGANIETVAED